MEATKPPKRAQSARVTSTVGGGTFGAALAQMTVELLNKPSINAGLSENFEKSLTIALIVVIGWAAGWIVRDQNG